MFFRIKSGANPHTRDRFGRRKQVDPARAGFQWNTLRLVLENHGVKVHVLAPCQEEPGLVFPANAGFRYGENFYLSNLNRARAGEREHYRKKLSGLGIPVLDLPFSYPFEGEADFIPVAHPSGDPARALFLFTYGRMERQRWVPHWGLPPYRRIYGFRSDQRVGGGLQSIVGTPEVLPLALTNEFHYHGDTVLCPFGPRQEFLLAYLKALSSDAQRALHRRLGDRLLPLSDEDGQGFAANSFQIVKEHYGEKVKVLLMPDGLTERLYGQIRARGVVPCPVDVSEFLEKGGGAVKCMLLNLAI